VDNFVTASATECFLRPHRHPQEVVDKISVELRKLVDTDGVQRPGRR
jgi:hypothetical protein